MADFALAPGEATNIALNAYFALKDWALKEPTAGVESRGRVQDLVLGSGNTNGAFPTNSSVGRNFPGAQLGRIFTGSTGWNTVSGFGYVLHFERGGQHHAIIAMRGTRPELGWYDLGTDFRFAHTGFGNFGRIHKGFANTFGSILPQLQREQGAILAADVIHCVGHSLGGAIATLAAAHYAALNRNVRLYTFGSPRVGYRNAHQAFERRIGVGNIYRVAHNRDPITMVATYPYKHVLAPCTEPNNFTLDSPFSSITMDNHDMQAYAGTLRGANEWSAVRGIAAAWDHSTWIISNDSTTRLATPWVTRHSVRWCRSARKTCIRPISSAASVARGSASRYPNARLKTPAPVSSSCAWPLPQSRGMKGRPMSSCPPASASPPPLDQVMTCIS